MSTVVSSSEDHVFHPEAERELMLSTEEAQAAWPDSINSDLIELYLPVVDRTFGNPEETEIMRFVDEKMANHRIQEESEFSEDPLTEYFKAIGQYPLLNRKDEGFVMQVIKRGVAALESGRDNESGRGDGAKQQIWEAAVAKDFLIKANLRFVANVAKRYYSHNLPPGVDFLDLINAGNIGLERAVNKFDWQKGYKFITYARSWIEQAIGDQLDHSHAVRLPTEKGQRLRQALKEIEMGLTEELNLDVEALYRVSQLPLSLEGDQENVPRPVDLLQNSESLFNPEIAIKELDRMRLITAVRESIDSLVPELRAALELRHGLVDGEQWTYKKIGEKLGHSPDAAKRRVQNAELALRSDLEHLEHLF